jgi:hypothetical protein
LFNKRINMIALLAVAVLMVFTAFKAPAFATGGSDETCVPQEAWTETVEHPEIPAVTEEQRTGWQRYSWNGPWESNTEAPPFPDERWQPNVHGDPHGVGVEGPYFRSNGNSGHGDWFYLEGIYETVVVTPAVPAWTEIIEHAAVTCPEDPEEPETPVETPEVPVNTPEIPTEEPQAPETPVEAEDDPVVQTTTQHQPDKTVKVRTHESGRVTREVIRYDEDRTEEGL